MGFLELLVTASVPVLKVLLVTGVGAFLATDYVNILGDAARKNMNNVVFYVFNPALVSTNLSTTITWESMISLWFMPINVLITFIVGSALGWIVIKMTKAPNHLHGLILGCCAAGNLGNLLLIIIPAMCDEKGSPFGDQDVCHTYGLTYASLSMALGAIFIWSYVYNIVRISSGAVGHTGAENVDGRITGTANLIPHKPINKSLTCKICWSADHSADGHYMDGVVALSSSNNTKPKVTTLAKVRHIFATITGVIDLKKLFAPSTIGVIVGFLIGLIPQIRKTLIGEPAPLRVIQDSAKLIGDAAIPSLTLIMGGNLTRGLRLSGVHPSVIIGVIVVRYVVLPILGILILKVAIHLNLVNSDPLYQFVLLIQYAVPPAMNIGTITQLFGAGESECSVIFLWAYALASVSLTIWSMIFMWLVSS